MRKPHTQVLTLEYILIVLKLLQEKYSLLLLR
jgi:hypothetical protein